MRATTKTCTHPGCYSAYAAKGLCARHYQQLSRGRLGQVRRYGNSAIWATLELRVPAELPKLAAELAERMGRPFAEVVAEALAAGLLRISRKL